MSAPATIVHERSLLEQGMRVVRLYAAQAKGRNGDNFSLFHLLGIGHLEVSTHSSILRDLLDPRGSHGQGAVFLKRFVERLGLPAFNFEAAEVKPEVGIGPVTETSGGRLDLVISDGTRKLILIENKIYAVEQANWVSRYLNHVPNAKLVYLTLDGRAPQNLEKGSRPMNLICASYRAEITDWLMECRKEAATAPILRESISQYLHLVQDLTQQSRNSAMNEELVKAASDSKDALEAYFALRNAEREIQQSIIRYLQERLSAAVQDRGITFCGSQDFDYSAKGGGFEFRIAKLGSMPLRIRFEFDRSGYRDFAFGFVDDGGLPAENRQQLKAIFAQAYENPNASLTWPAWIYWSRYQNWSTGEAFTGIRFGSFVNDVLDVLWKMCEIIDLSGIRPAESQNLSAN